MSTTADVPRRRIACPKCGLQLWRSVEMLTTSIQCGRHFRECDDCGTTALFTEWMYRGDLISEQEGWEFPE